MAEEKEVGRVGESRGDRHEDAWGRNPNQMENIITVEQNINKRRRKAEGQGKESGSLGVSRGQVGEEDAL